MASANFIKEGKADTICSGSLTSTPQWAHHVTVAALFHLKSQAFTTITQG